MATSPAELHSTEANSEQNPFFAPFAPRGDKARALGERSECELIKEEKDAPYPSRFALAAQSRSHSRYNFGWKPPRHYNRPDAAE